MADPALDIDLRYVRVHEMRQAQQRRPRLPGPLRTLGAVGTFVPTPPADRQRTVVAGVITQSHTTGPHLQYLQQGKGRAGQDAALFGAAGCSVDPRQFAMAAQQDPHQFRLSISLDREHPYFALQPYIETLMQRVEKDLGRPLAWVAATHYDTAHTHTHVVLRGRDREGTDLYILNDYLTHGWRYRADQIATWLLGPVREPQQMRQPSPQALSPSRAPSVRGQAHSLERD